MFKQKQIRSAPQPCFDIYFDYIIKIGVETETVVEDAMKELMSNVNSGGCVDSWMQDQVRC